MNMAQPPLINKEEMFNKKSVIFTNKGNIEIELYAD